MALSDTRQAGPRSAALGETSQAECARHISAVMP